MRTRPLSYWLGPALVAALLALGSSALAVTIDWVAVGNPGNPADTPSSNCVSASCGAVSYSYYISKYEVTNEQYAEFLNAKAASDPVGLYSLNMGATSIGGITRSGVSGSYTYTVKPGKDDLPVLFVTFWDTLRFANWLQNGQGSGSTETGAYTLLGGTPTPSNVTVGRNAGAVVFLPSENEWYKAAYYSPGGVYFDYPTGTNTPTTCATPTATANRANCGLANGSAVTAVGAYTGSASPYGTFDQGGNAWEWNEQIAFGGSYRGLRGGMFFYGAIYTAASSPSYASPGQNGDYTGFRVASLVPEPGTGILVMVGMLGLATTRLSKSRSRRER